MKKLICAVLVFALLCGALPTAFAVPTDNLYFYGTNDSIDVSQKYLPPVTKDSVMYLPLNIFIDNFSTSYSYDSVSNVLTIMYKGKYLSFNNNYGFAIDQDKVLHFITYFIEGVSFYIPAKEVCSLLGLNYAYYDEIQTVRIYESGKLSSVDYIKKHTTLVAQTINSFYSKNLYLTFEGPLTKDTLTILDTLKSYSINAVFFVSQSDLINSPKMVRAIVTRGFDIGFIMPMTPEEAMADPGAFMDKLSDMNTLLSVVAKTKTRLIRHYFSSSVVLPDSLKAPLIEGGWRLWGYNFSSTAKSSQAIFSYLSNRLVYRQSATILTLYINPYASEVIRLLYDFAANNNFFYSKISETTHPLNSFL